MAIIFATSCARDLIGGNLSQYSGAAQSRDAAYSSEEIAVAVFSNVASGFVTPLHDTASTVVWYHFRMNTTVDPGSSADGLFAYFKDVNGAEIARIDCNNGVFYAQASAGTVGLGYAPLAATTVTYDIRIESSGTDCYIDMYVDGALVSTSTSGANKLLPSYMDCQMDDVVGVGQDTTFYLSEFIIDDAESTLGCRLCEMPATADGNYTDMTGDYTALADYDDGDDIRTDTALDKYSASHGAYGGDASPTAIRAVVVSTQVTPGFSGPPGFTPFLRVGGVDYFDSSVVLPAAAVGGAVAIWPLNPDDSAAWEVSDLAGFEVGVRADA